MFTVGLNSPLLFCCVFYTFTMRDVIAVSPMFCNELVPEPLSLEMSEKMFPMFGEEDQSLQVLLSGKSLVAAYSKLSNCLQSVCPIDTNCIKEIRGLFYDFMKNKSLVIDGYNFSSVDKQTFTDFENKVSTPATFSMEILFRVGCITMCHMFHYYNMTSVYECACFNPCDHQKSCSRNNCQRRGIFQHQYKCNCSPQTKWDPELYICVSSTVTKLREKTKTEVEVYDPSGCAKATNCDPEGTLLCKSDVTETFFTCICKPQYTGSTCDELVDACKLRVQHPFLPRGGMLAAGETACNTNADGNACRSFISSEGDVTYGCNCQENNWIPNHELSYDNCLKRRSMCDSVICVHGRCVTNERGTQPHCLCKPGYRGASCTEWVGEWTEWSPWDKCTPSCGDVRYSVRTRDCLTMMPERSVKRECLGSAIEYAPCAEHPCARTEGTFVNTYFAIRQSGIAASISAAAVVCAIVTGLWSIYCWSIISRILLALAKKLMNSLNRTTETPRPSPSVNEEVTTQSRESD